MFAAHDVTVTFGGVHAVDGVSIGIDRGEVVGLIGPNGSGKTTLLNAMTGYLRANRGTVTLDGTDVTRWPVERLPRHGVGRTYQTPKLFTSLTVRGNIEAAFAFSTRQPRFWRGLLGAERLDGAADPAAVDDLMERAGVAHLADRPASELALGQARQVEVARALATASGFLLLDEPGAGLRAEDLDQSGRLLRSLAAERDIGVLIIEHNVPFVRSFCDRVYVLNFGRVLAEGPTETALADREVARAYLGVGG